MASGCACRTSTTTWATASSSCRCAAIRPTATRWPSSPSSTPAARWSASTSGRSSPAAVAGSTASPSRSLASALLVVAIGALAPVDAHVDRPSDVGDQLEQQAVLGLHVGEERVAPGGGHVLVDQAAGDRPDVEVRQLAGHDVPVDADVPGNGSHRLDAQR